MILVGIDIAKNKHDCFIRDSYSEVFFKPFTIANTMQDFDELFEKISSVCSDFDNIKVGLEATGHYSYNILGYLLDKGLPIYVINPLHTNLFRKGQSLRKTKTDKVDCSTLASMLISDVKLKSYSQALYHNEELKSLTRYRFDKVRQRARLKQSISRLVIILFPELEKLVSTLHSLSIYALLSEFPSAKAVASANLIKLTNILEKLSKGKFFKSTPTLFRDAARNSIGSNFASKTLELKHTIKSIAEIDFQIKEIEADISIIMEQINYPITTIPGIGQAMAAQILAEIGDFDNFDSPDKILAYAGLSPTTYQSGQVYSTHAKMEKRGSRYLRYALYNATKYACFWDPIFGAYLSKKRVEEKHYNVAISHVAKKLVRVIYHLQKSKQSYIK